MDLPVTPNDNFDPVRRICDFDGMVYPWILRYRLVGGGDWGDVDALLSVLAERNPDFRVVFRGEFDAFGCSIGGERDRVDSVVKDCLPLVSSQGLVIFEQVPHVENRFRKSGILYIPPLTS